jgi:hypothetical protein
MLREKQKQKETETLTSGVEKPTLQRLIEHYTKQIKRTEREM